MKFLLFSKIGTGFDFVDDSQESVVVNLKIKIKKKAENISRHVDMI